MSQNAFDELEREFSQDLDRWETDLDQSLEVAIARWNERKS